MESLGEKLKNAREARGYTIAELQEYTHIMDAHIKALENEQYELLPGEVYVKGFLRNLALALELDPIEVLALYKRAKLSEEPPPYDELLRKDKTKMRDFAPIIIAASVILFVGAIGVALFFYFSSLSADFSQRAERLPVREKETKEERPINVVDNRISLSVRKGDVIYFRPLGISASIKIVDIANTIKVRLNDKEVSFAKDNPALSDLNENGEIDFRMKLLDVIEDVARIELEKVEERLVMREIEEKQKADERVEEESGREVVEEREEEESTSYEANPYASVSDGVKIVGDTMYVLGNVDKEPIEIKLTAKGICYVRYFIDSEKPETLTLYGGKNLSLNAQDTIVINIGNAGQVLTEINGKTVVLGKEGELVSKTVKWIQNPDNETKFSLVVIDKR